MSSSGSSNESSAFHDTEIITADDSYSDWEVITNRSESKSPEPGEPPQSPLHAVTLALAEIRRLFADPVTDSPLPCEPAEPYDEPTESPEVIKKLRKESKPTMEEFDESIEHSAAPGMRNPTSSVDSIGESAGVKLVESELFNIRKSHIRKAIKELEMVNSSMLATITRGDLDDPRADDKPKLARKKRQRRHSSTKRKPNTAESSTSRNLEEFFPCPSQADQHEPFPAFTIPAPGSPPHFAPPSNSIACRFRAVGLYYDPEPKPEEDS
ncbi:uncharacterized protein LAJ45_03453 [Morchella importuna]|uniref:uncharacterized protein n=1 Tax=Morchella importuna TaxID=1174673 RepID=UPI001E8E0C70|nr:uncharacterized protein LAJ45_03453 [Morchella importuna]KAH8152612.1 hypothetical protein LAJ45_03453 [Morchella importuna]